MTLLRGALRTIALVVGACCLSWLGGLLWFATPPSGETRAAATDAIVVLTGGSLRLQSGIDLLREGKGRKLFVSGVNQRVDLDDLLGVSGHAPEAATPDWALCCIVLGHQADDTLGNALETAEWIRAQGFRSLRLVTAWYHMPRSLLEFDRAMPEIDVMAHPVFPDQVKQERWWTWRGTALLLVSEYVKYLGALARPLIERRQPATISRPNEPASAEMQR
jgi:uncharacterized SAM-binding protein YcdF (DUF218 family)